MPLIPVAEPAVVNDGQPGVRFSMKDGGKLVAVLVTLDALENKGPPTSPDEQIERFKQHRKTFEQVASAKYEQGLVEDDGTILITPADLAQHAG